MDNFHLFLLQQTDKRQTSVCTIDRPMVNGLRKIAWASVFRLMSPVSMSLFPCLHFSCPCFHVYVSILPCLCLYFPMSPFLHVYMSPCLWLHVSGIQFRKRKRNWRKTQLPFVCCKRKMEMANFRLFAANGKWKRQTSVCLLQTENGNGKLSFVYCKRKWKMEVLLSLVGKQ